MKKNYTAIMLFFITTLTVGQSQIVTVSVDDITPLCYADDCITLNANFIDVNATTEYTVGSIPYSPLFPFTGGTVLSAIGDDYWSPQFDLPFNFCFYGTSYNKLLVGTNGLITFDLINQTPNGFCSWPLTTTIPETNFPIRNAIYGVYQDTDISQGVIDDDTTPDAIQNVNYYLLDTGVNTAPNRVFVANFNELPLFQCGDNVGLQTSQIVIYETSNIIEIFVNKRTSCTTWNSGNGLIGIQNQAGTLASVPAGRNTGTWSATNEAWRFTPSGNNITELSWSLNGVSLATNENPLTLCDVANSVIRASVSYANCDGSFTTISSEEVIPTVQPEPDFSTPVDITVCGLAPSYVTDISVNTPIVLAALNPGDYEVLYYHTFEDAQNQTFTYIVNANNYTFTGNETLYMSIVDAFNTGCVYVESFDLVVNYPDSPIAESMQYYTTGQTLADLVVNGQNIQWHDNASDGNLLPSTTILQDMTYYASQSIDGCEGSRIAIAAINTLSRNEFNNSQLSVFPNPVNNILHISYSENIERIEIYNTIGQLIISEAASAKQAKVDMSAVSSGTYFVKIHSGDKQKTIKVVRQ